MYLVPFVKHSISKYWFFLEIRVTGLVIQGMAPFDRACGTSDHCAVVMNKITNDIYSAFDAHQSTILVALDQSAAFDCIDPKIMISRLQHTFGVTDEALNWFVSYFDARSIFVRRSGTSSATTACNYGVPQGSSLGPLCFNLYIAPLSSVIGSLACGIINTQTTPRCTLQPRRTTSRWTSTHSKSVPPPYISGYCTTACSWIPASPRRFCSQLLEGDSLSTTHRRYRSLTPSFNRQQQSKVSASIASGINIYSFFLDIQKIFWISEKEFVIPEILAH